MPTAPTASSWIAIRTTSQRGGILLVPGQRTIAAALRVMGLGQTRRFERYHRVQWT